MRTLKGIWRINLLYNYFNCQKSLFQTQDDLPISIGCFFDFQIFGELSVQENLEFFYILKELPSKNLERATLSMIHFVFFMGSDEIYYDKGGIGK